MDILPLEEGTLLDYMRMAPDDGMDPLVGEPLSQILLPLIGQALILIAPVYLYDLVVGTEAVCSLEVTGDLISVDRIDKCRMRDG